MSKTNIDLLLTEWGIWRRKSTIGLEFPVASIEPSEQGTYSKKPEMKNGIYFSGSKANLTVDTLIRKLKQKHRQEMEVIIMLYVLNWSEYKIHKAAQSNRPALKRIIERAKMRISVALEI